MDDAAVLTKVTRLRLPEILKELGWTQVELSRRTGLSENSITRLMNNPKMIYFETIGILSEATGKSIDELIEIK
jgi:transcriptional regulator with XRE-family HTH domain